MKNTLSSLVATALTVAIAAGACSSNGESSEGLVLDPVETVSRRLPGAKFFCSLANGNVRQVSGV